MRVPVARLFTVYRRSSPASRASPRRSSLGFRQPRVWRQRSRSESGPSQNWWSKSLSAVCAICQVPGRRRQLFEETCCSGIPNTSSQLMAACGSESRFPIQANLQSRWIERREPTRTRSSGAAAERRLGRPRLRSVVSARLTSVSRSASRSYASTSARTSEAASITTHRFEVECRKDSRFASSVKPAIATKNANLTDLRFVRTLLTSTENVQNPSVRPDSWPRRESAGGPESARFAC